MKYVVTGGTGFLGRHLVSRLEAAGHTVAVPRSASCDLLELGQVKAFLERERPDRIIHSAAYYGGLGINGVEPAESELLGKPIVLFRRLRPLEQPEIHEDGGCLRLYQVGRAGDLAACRAMDGDPHRSPRSTCQDSLRGDALLLLEFPPSLITDEVIGLSLPLHRRARRVFGEADMGDRIFDRLQENAKVLACDWTSHRRMTHPGASE